MASHIFISHASKDDAFVKDLRLALEGLNLEVWADSRELSGGDKLTPKINQAIATARHFLAVVSLNALNSGWVQREVQRALEIEKQRQSDGDKVIPLMFPDIQPPVLKLLFGEEPVGVKIQLKAGSVSETLPHILAALGERLPDDPKSQPTAPAKPVAELLLKLSDRAQRMIARSIAGTADCFCDLGRFDEAAEAYEKSLRHNENSGDQKHIATNKANLGRVYMFQRQYSAALKCFQVARHFYEVPDEPDSVANCLHHIGMIYRETKQFGQAEQANRLSLAIRVRQKDPFGEANSLGELGNLYTVMERFGDAVKFYRQAAEIHTRLSHQQYEGVTRSNLSNALINLHHYDEARHELRRAIECKQPFGHAAESWKTWNILCKLERVTDNPQAAAQAQERARALYLQYRRDGGESRANTAPLHALMAQALSAGTPDALTAASAQLVELSKADIPAWGLALTDKLQAVLRGDRDPALAADPELFYMDAVELQLLLEGLGPAA